MIQDILNFPSRKINIKGVAGAGKTSLVVNLAKSCPEKSFLYLSFGRENTQNAKQRMPLNVFCSSFHSLARKKLNIKPERIVGRFSLTEISSIFKALKDPVESVKMLECITILNDLFCLSGTQLHRIHDVLDKNKNIFPSFNKIEREEILVRFKHMWSSVWEQKSSLPVTHDMYLKQYALNTGILHDLDYLIIDETQDLNDAMFSVVQMLSASNPELTVIKLGDPSQQIFSFRGASGQFLNENFQFSLNTTKRFGAELSTLVNEFMSAQSLPYYSPISHSDIHTQVKSAQTISDLMKRVKAGERPTVIARYNMTLWYMLKKLSQAGINCSMKGSEQDDLAFLMELHNVFKGGKSNHPRLARISYNRFKKVSQGAQDRQGLLACRFVESLSSDDTSTFSMLKKHLVQESKAEVLLTTVHQSKGLEFNDVVMMDDFVQCKEKNDGRFFKITREEAHIIYTALTRAKRSIYLPKSWGKDVGRK